MENNMEYLYQAMWLVVKSFFLGIYEGINIVIGLNYKHYIAYAITGVLMTIIFRAGRENGIWFGREGGTFIGVVLYAIVCAVITPVINLFS